MAINISITPPTTDDIRAQIDYLFEILSSVEARTESEKIEFRLDEMEWTSPHFLVPFACFLYDLRDHQVQYTITGIDQIQNTDVQNYLETICFPDGFNPFGVSWEEIFSNLKHWKNVFSEEMTWREEIVNAGSGKHHIPIMVVPTSSDLSEVKGYYHTQIDILIKDHIGLTEGFHKQAITYLIAENIHNIEDHANVKLGLLQAQYYPTKQHLDVCIADHGISILGSYQNAGKTDVKDDRIALKCAISGDSTKKGKERGFGISTSKKMLTSSQGLGGIYMLLSGDALYCKTPTHEEIVQLPARWNGTLAFFRIPKAPEGFDFYSCVE